MSKAKSPTEKNESVNAQIEKAKEEIRQHQNRLKRLTQTAKDEERKARTHRLCERGGYLESIMPDTITLTDEQFRLFLDKTLLTEYTRRTLTAIKTGQARPATNSPTGAERNGNSDAHKTEGNGARQGA